jgi:glycosyltransferase involved in cell wall biosynthesis
MKVAFVEQVAQMGGVEYTTLRVAQSLNTSIFEPIIICPEEGDLPRLARQAGIRVELVPRPNFASVSFLAGKRYIANPFGFVFTAVNVFRAADTLYRHLQKHPVDLVITKGLLSHFYGGWAARRAGIPCVWYVQEEVDARRGGGLFRLLLRQAGKRLPKKVVVDAEALLEQFGAPAAMNDHIRVIYNGIDTDEFAPFQDEERHVARARLGIPEDAVVIGQAGRLIPLKGQDILIHAFFRLVKEFPNLHLVLVGTPLFGNGDFEQALRKQVARSGLTEQAHFTGFLPDVRQGLAAMDIFVHPSVETDSPVSVMEAMACGLPVVVSGVRGTLELVVPGCDALVVSPGDPDSLARSLVKLIKNKDFRKEIGMQARTSVLQKYSLTSSVAQLEALLEQVYAA